MTVRDEQRLTASWFSMTNVAFAFARDVCEPLNAELMHHPPEYINVGADESDVFKWNVTIQGPPGTP